jgi:hypothetical protein
MTADDGNKPSVFARYIDDQTNTVSPELSRSQKLLEWLQHNWTQPTISARDIYHYGPHSIRDRESAIKAAKILVKHGWLVPIETRRCNMKKWQITKKLKLPRFRGHPIS